MKTEIKNDKFLCPLPIAALLLANNYDNELMGIEEYQEGRLFAFKADSCTAKEMQFLTDNFVDNQGEVVGVRYWHAIKILMNILKDRGN